MTDYKEDEGECLIIELMLEMGYECCSSVASVRDLLADKPIKERDIAEILGYMARTYTNMAGVRNGPADNVDESATWNVENFLTVVKEKVPELDWYKVFENMDHPHFFLFDAKGLDILVKAWKLCPNSDQPFPVNVFFNEWHNLRGQLTALYQIANAPIHLVNSATCSKRAVIRFDDFVQSSTQIRSMTARLLNNQLNSLDLIERIIELANTSVADDAKVLLEKILVKKEPELLFMGLLQIDTVVPGSIHEDLLNKLITSYLDNNANSVMVLTKFWKVKPELFKSHIIGLYSKEPTALTRILAFVHELKALPAILDMQPSFFTIDLAALATRREYLDLERWMQDKNLEYGGVFAQTCLRFLSKKVRAELSRHETNSTLTTVPLSVDVVTIFTRVLSEIDIEPQEKELLYSIHSTFVQLSRGSTISPTTLNKLQLVVDATSPAITTTTIGDITFRKDIEDEVNLYYKKIYNGEVTIDEMIGRLTRFNISSHPREQDIYACMIHNLLEKFHLLSKCSDKELAITSMFLGSLIQNQLMAYAPLGVALRCILDALNNKPGSIMYDFGLQTVIQFRSRLYEWPQLCTHLLQIPALQANPDLFQFIKDGVQTGQMQLQSLDKIVAPNLSISDTTKRTVWAENNTTATTTTTAPVNIFTAINVPEMVYDENFTYKAPNEAIQDKILFIINNVALNNLNIKANDLKEKLDKPAYQWFSNYLVAKRVSIEPNYHDLYLLVLRSVDSKLLHQHILHETFKNIKTLLSHENTVSSSADRTLLKNLGSWLGGMTLAQNKPIIQKHLAFKKLLLEGYDSNRLIVVIPFVCKVLEQGVKNTVFIPPNPWVMAILKLLVELYQNANLKLNLKFEIEVLCKSLSIEVNSIEPTAALKNRQSLISQTTETAARTDSNPTINLISGIPSTLTDSIENDGLPIGTRLITQPTADTIDNDSLVNISNIGSYLVLNPQITMYSTQSNFKKWVLQAAAQSIREIIGPVIERSVAVAAISTRELITKDFAVESDENKMRKAAHAMAQSLAGSLAIVTCKEPLRTSMITHMCTLLVHNGLGATIAEQTASIIVADNLDLVCAAIEKATVEKAIIEVDESLMNAYASRKRHREHQQHNGGVVQPYFDMKLLSISTYPTLPEPLCPNPNGLFPHQLRIYEDFMHIPRSAGQMMDQQQISLMDRQSMSLNSHSEIQQGIAPNFNELNQLIPQQPFPQQQQPAITHQLLERFSQYINELENIINTTNAPHFAALPIQHDIITIIRQISILAASSFGKTEAALAFARKAVQLLYKSETQLGCEVYVMLLGRLCSISEDASAIVTSWLTHADDERKYSVPVTIALIKANLINISKQDQELASLIDYGRVSAIDFTARLIHACMFDESLSSNRQEFIASFKSLSRLRGNVPDSVAVLMEERRRNSPAFSFPSTPTSTLSPQDFLRTKEDNTGVRERFHALFSEWVRICQHSTCTGKMLNAFVAQLSQQGILKIEDDSSLFFRVCIETSVDHAIKYKQLPGQSPEIAYQPIDAFSKLVVSLLKLQQPSTPVGTPAINGQSNTHMTVFKKVLSIIVLIAAQHHEQRQQQFNQRPFLRLFTSLFSELHSAEQQLQPIFASVLIALSTTLNTLQPSLFPGFSFGWLQLISHRLFMPKLLVENQKGRLMFHGLLICLLKFLRPFLCKGQLKDTTRVLYRGTLRILLVLLHDFPEFLCDYYNSLCDMVPSSCIQLRNLILSAFPRNMQLPDPFTLNLKVDLLPEINQAPNNLPDYASVLHQHGNLKHDIDEYLKSRQNNSFLTKLPSLLLLAKQETDDDGDQQTSNYNIPAMNALVFYIGIFGASEGTPVSHGPLVELLQHVLTGMDAEGRYLFLSAIANHLRYPNSHTHYFSRVILYLFESTKEAIKEQITRVLLERLIVNRPHPWGLLTTFVELVKNPRYNFWNHSFTRCSTDIEYLFESVSRSINQT